MINYAFNYTPIEINIIMTNYTYPSSIRSAAAILDVAVPGWYKKIDTVNLKMSNAEMCILGQAYGGFYAALREIFGGYNSAIAENDEVFGCNAGVGEWIREIGDRLSKAEALPEGMKINLADMAEIMEDFKALMTKGYTVTVSVVGGKLVATASKG